MVGGCGNGRFPSTLEPEFGLALELEPTFESTFSDDFSVRTGEASTFSAEGGRGGTINGVIIFSGELGFEYPGANFDFSDNGAGEGSAGAAGRMKGVTRPTALSTDLR